MRGVPQLLRFRVPRVRKRKGFSVSRESLQNRYTLPSPVPTQIMDCYNVRKDTKHGAVPVSTFWRKLPYAGRERATSRKSMAQTK